MAVHLRARSRSASDASHASEPPDPLDPGNSSGDATSHTERAVRLFHLIGMAVFGVTFALWIGCVVYVPESIDRDWVAFDIAADRLVQDGPTTVYRDSMREEWPFLYPPYVLPLVAPLAATGRTPSYLLCAAGGLVAVAMALRLLRRVRPVDERRADAVRAGVLGSGVVLANVITGQFAPLYLLGLAVALWAWQQRRPGLAGCALGVLLIKPYLALPFVGYLVLRRERRALAAFAAVAAAATAIGLGFGTAPWLAYADSLRYMASKERIGLTPTSKQVTFASAGRMLLAGGGSTPWLQVAWLLIAGVCALLVLRALRRSAARSPGSTPTLRQLGLVALFTVVASPRLYFYDAVLVVVAAVACYVEADTYASQRRRRAILGCIAASVVVFDTILTPFPATHLAGLTMLAWLVLEAIDLANSGSVTPNGVRTAAPSAGSRSPGTRR